jgi:hypothetical protein
MRHAQRQHGGWPPTPGHNTNSNPPWAAAKSELRQGCLPCRDYCSLHARDMPTPYSSCKAAPCSTHITTATMTPQPSQVTAPAPAGTSWTPAQPNTPWVLLGSSTGWFSCRCHLSRFPPAVEGGSSRAQEQARVTAGLQLPEPGSQPAMIGTVLSCVDNTPQVGAQIGRICPHSSCPAAQLSYVIARCCGTSV